MHSELYHQRRFLPRVFMLVAWAISWALSSLAYAESGKRPSPVTRSENPKDRGSRIYAETNPTGSSTHLLLSRKKERFPLAIHGFSVVDLRDHQQWVAGTSKYQAVFDGQIYRFADARQRDIFAAAPQRYAPALGGDCIVTFADTGSRTLGNLHYGLLHQQRLFFFAGIKQREQFRVDPEIYGDADLAHQGICIVSKIDRQREVEGLPETVATVGGLRYFFMGAQQQMLFLMNLRRYGAEIAMDSESDSPQSKQNVASPNPLTPENPSHPTEPSASELSADSSEMEENLQGRAATDSTIALAGFCPVSIRDNGTWDKGAARHQLEYDGKIYHFVGETEKALFVRNPIPYIPALAGDCTITFMELNKRIPGSIFQVANFEDRLFLFAGAEEKQAFKTNPSAYANLDLALKGNCVVTLREKEETAAGLPEHMTWYRGIRYFFASEELKGKFLADPEAYVKPISVEPSNTEPDSVELGREEVEQERAEEPAEQQ